MNFSRTFAIVACSAITVACSGETSGPAPESSPPIEVTGGSAQIELVHKDQTMTFDHVKAIRRFDEEAGADRILVVFTQEEVEDDSLTHPFEPFDLRSWAIANHPQELRSILSVVIDPQEPAQPLACDVFAEPPWMGGSCGKFDSSLEVTVTNDSIEGSMTMLDFFGMEQEGRAWKAAGSFEVPVATIEAPEMIAGAEAVASAQVKRLQALEAALANGDVKAMEEHATTEAFAEFTEAAEQWGEKELIAMMQGIGSVFEDLDVADEDVTVKLYTAGERSRLEMVKKDEEGSTTTNASNFRWVDGRWLLDD